MIIEKYLLILSPSLRQKTAKHMTKSYCSQVMPAVISYSCWYAFFVDFIFGNTTILCKQNGFFTYN